MKDIRFQLFEFCEKKQDYLEQRDILEEIINTTEFNSLRFEKRKNTRRALLALNELIESIQIIKIY